ncbi:MAG: DUF1810 domain-containing protein [Acidobacteriia bacterium]|nr:DUF1810 domain-containing protein [Terriglobia bacterium]
MPVQRFLSAQNDSYSGFDAALGEIRAGRKTGHWIWYVFPQLSGLGGSAMAQRYGVDGVEEAVEYLRHPELCERLLTITAAVADQLRAGTSVERLMGSSIDALKLVSSMTLFANVARRLAVAEAQPAHGALARAADDVLAAAAAEGYPPCRFTIDQLNQ